MASDRLADGYRGRGTYEGWRRVAVQRGVQDLFEAYLAALHASGASYILFNENRSVVGHYRHDGAGQALALMSVLPGDSERGRGLWIGYSETNARKLGLPVPPPSLPEGFAGRPQARADNTWRFGYIADADQLRAMIAGLTGRR
jgi:hypothetical protein